MHIELTHCVTVVTIEVLMRIGRGNDLPDWHQTIIILANVDSSAVRPHISSYNIDIHNNFNK